MLTPMAPHNKLKPKWRWLQFSTRTMLAVVTALCVALRLLVVPVERQRRTVAAIKAIDGTVSYVNNHAASEPFPVTFLRGWLPQDYFDEVASVSFVNARVTDAGFGHVQRLSGLRELHLINTHITDAGLQCLQRLTSLQSLQLTDAQFTDPGLAHVRRLTGLRRL